MREYYCIACLQHRSEKHFSIWVEDKSKARRCNECHNDDKVKQRLINSQKERKAKPPPVSPILTKLSKDLDSKSKCIVRDRLADIAMQKEIDEFVGDVD